MQIREIIKPEDRKLLEEKFNLDKMSKKAPIDELVDRPSMTSKEIEGIAHFLMQSLGTWEDLDS